MSTSIENEKKVLTLKSSDNEEFVVEESVAIQSQTIKNMVDDDCASTAIPLPNVNSATLIKVIEYLIKHADAAVSEDDLKSFDAEFVKEPMNVIFDLTLAANYLDIKKLLDITCQKVADDIKNKSPEAVRKIFGIKNDYTPKEEAEVRKENDWAFEGIKD